MSVKNIVAAVESRKFSNVWEPKEKRCGMYRGNGRPQYHRAHSKVERSTEWTPLQSSNSCRTETTAQRRELCSRDSFRSETAINTDMPTISSPGLSSMAPTDTLTPVDPSPCSNEPYLETSSQLEADEPDGLADLCSSTEEPLSKSKFNMHASSLLVEEPVLPIAACPVPPPIQPCCTDSLNATDEDCNNSKSSNGERLPCSEFCHDFADGHIPNGKEFTQVDRLSSRDEDCIGFATLPDQIHRKVVKRGFHFTIMVVGESGLGKSTLINSLFTTDLYADRKTVGVEDKIERTIEITKSHLDIEEKNVKLRMSVIDTPGYGDSLNGANSYKHFVKYIDEQFLQYLQAESGLNRKNIQDNRVHCLLHFLSPSSQGLKPLDLEVMKCLHQKVNIIPIIAKADTLTQKERAKLKQQILSDLEKHQISIYDFPRCDSDDESFKKAEEDFQAAVPFAVIGSNTVLEVNGKRVRGRTYPWGIVEVENVQHSDFARLRKMLICTHLQDLKDVTDEVHYENFRAEYIQLAVANNNNNNHSENSDIFMPSVEKRLLEKEAELKKTKDLLTMMERKLSSGRLLSQV